MADYGGSLRNATGQVPGGCRRRLAARVRADRSAPAGSRSTAPRSPIRHGTSPTRTRWRSMADAFRALDERVVYALNKPAGVVSTARDPQGRPTVVTMVPQTERLYPVGRLDIDTTGLILLTNQGELAHRLTHPSFEVEKTYRAVVAGPPLHERTLRALREGSRARGRPHRAGPRAPDRGRHDRDHHPRGPQAPGQADVRGGRPSGQAPGADPVRSAGAGESGAGPVAQADRRRGRGADVRG